MRPGMPCAVGTAKAAGGSDEKAGVEMGPPERSHLYFAQNQAIPEAGGMVKQHQGTRPWACFLQWDNAWVAFLAGLPPF